MFFLKEHLSPLGRCIYMYMYNNIIHSKYFPAHFYGRLCEFENTGNLSRALFKTRAFTDFLHFVNSFCSECLISFCVCGCFRSHVRFLFSVTYVNFG